MQERPLYLQDNTTECPISLEAIQDAALTPCGHVFEFNNIKDLVEKQREKAVCPCCREPLIGPSAFLRSTALSSAYAQITKSDQAIQALQKQVDELKKANQAQAVIIHELSKESKNAASIPRELQVAMIDNKNIAQDIAEMQLAQAQNVIIKSIKARSIAKKFDYLAGEFNKLISDIKQFHAEHTTEQKRLQDEIIRLMNLFNPATIIPAEDKNNEQPVDNVALLNLVTECTKQLASNQVRATARMQGYQQKFAQSFIIPLKNNLVRRESLLKLNAITQETGVKLQQLHTRQESMLSHTSNIARKRTKDTPLLFGGSKFSQQENIPQAAQAEARALPSPSAPPAPIGVSLLPSLNIFLPAGAAPAAVEVKSVKPKANCSQEELLYTACRRNKLDEVKTLLESFNFNLNMRYGEGEYTVLHWAAWYHNLELVKILIENGASLLELNKDRKTPIEEMNVDGGSKIAKTLSPQEKQKVLDYMQKKYIEQTEAAASKAFRRV